MQAESNQLVSVAQRCLGSILNIVCIPVVHTLSVYCSVAYISLFVHGLGLSNMIFSNDSFYNPGVWKIFSTDYIYASTLYSVYICAYSFLILHRLFRVNISAEGKDSNVTNRYNLELVNNSQEAISLKAICTKENQYVHEQVHLTGQLES